MDSSIHFRRIESIDVGAVVTGREKLERKNCRAFDGRYILHYLTHRQGRSLYSSVVPVHFCPQAVVRSRSAIQRRQLNGKPPCPCWFDSISEIFFWVWLRGVITTHV